MLPRRTTPLLLALLATAPVDLVGQQGPVVRAGDRVRVTAPDILLGRLVRNVVRLTADSCVLQVEERADTSALALASLKKLEVVRGQRSYGLEGAALGTAVGMIVGYVVSYPAALLGTECAAEIWDRCVATTGSLIGGGLGFLVGANLGRRHKRYRWVAVPLDRLRVGPAADPGGAMSASVSIVF